MHKNLETLLPEIRSKSYLVDCAVAFGNAKILQMLLTNGVDFKGWKTQKFSEYVNGERYQDYPKDYEYESYV